MNTPKPADPRWAALNTNTGPVRWPANPPPNAPVNAPKAGGRR